MAPPTTRFRPSAPRLARVLLGACGLWLVALGLYFVFLRPALLPEDPRYIGVTLERLREAAPGLEAWLRIVFAVMGGHMVGLGIFTLLIAVVLLPYRPSGTAWALAVTGGTTVVLMSAMNFVLHSDFRWMLVLPALLWVMALVASLRRI